MTASQPRRPAARLAIFLVVIALVATGLGPVATTARAGSIPAKRPSSGCTVRPAATPGSTDQTLTSGGLDRRYQLDVPSGYDGTRPYALVFGLHALTVSYKIIPTLSGFPDMVTKFDFIDVSPSGLLNGPAPYWNAAPVADNYDVTFLTKLLDRLEATLCIDTTRVFSVGMSNGAQMSSLLACRLPNRIDGIAPIAGVEFNQPCHGRPVPVIAFHGVLDPIVPYNGGGLNSVTIANQSYYHDKLPSGLPTPTGVDESMQRWARHNGCGARYAEQRVSPEVRKRSWPHCKAATVLYIVDNGGHAWPGKPQPAFEPTFGHGTTDIDATSLMFAFFFDHRA